MNNKPTWMLYGAAGHTGSLIAQQACDVGHRPLLAGRSESAVKTLVAVMRGIDLWEGDDCSDPDTAARVWAIL